MPSMAFWRTMPTRSELCRIAAAAFLASTAVLVAGPAFAQDVNVSIPGGGSLTRSLLQLLTITTVLALAPSIAVTVTSFTRLVIVFSILRSALGLQQSPPNLVLTSLALFMTLFIMAPTFDQALQDGVTPYLDSKLGEKEALMATISPFRDFMARNVGREETEMLTQIAKKKGISPTDTEGRPDIRVLIPAFMLSELRVAFEMGFLIFLPFLVIDLAVSSILMAMGMMMVPPVLISLPFKIIFFVFSNGWVLLVGSLLQSYR